MALITKIGIPPRVTVEGPPPNFDKVTKIGTGYNASNTTPVGIGQAVTKELRISSVGNSQAGVVFDAFKATGRMRVIAVEYGTQAITATATAKVYNSTQSLDILASVTPATTPAYSSTIVTPIVEKDDIVQLIATTDGSGAFTNLHFKLICQYIDAPVNAQA